MPAVVLQSGSVRGLETGEGQLESLGGTRGEAQDLLPFVMLAPVVYLAVVEHVTSVLAVVADRRERTRLRLARHGPQLEIDGLTRHEILDAIQGHAAIRSAIVLAVGRNSVMRVEGDARVLVSHRQPQLGRDRI